MAERDGRGNRVIVVGLSQQLGVQEVSNMKRSFFRFVVIALVALGAMLPQAIAFARAEDSDNGCPPRSTEGFANASANAIAITAPINPPAPGQAWAATNPGKK